MDAVTPYIKIARLDHWLKNVFVLPGMVFALFLNPGTHTADLTARLLLALLASCLVASSNYVINEILDSDHDRKHPVKKYRPIPSGQVNFSIAYAEWIFLAGLGLAMASVLGREFFISALLLWIMGGVYNIPPIRSKERPYIDVLSESVNNPIRFLLGWYATGTAIIPPVSILTAYWMLGAFFMSVKRLAELRTIGDKKIAQAYRRSFKHYNEERLLISILYYVSTFSLFLGVFLIRYRVELILAIPFIAGFVTWYMKLGFQKDSPAQYPERLYKENAFIVYAVFCSVLFVGLLFIDIPIVGEIFKKHVAV